jgi:hypothetical protein
MSATLLTCAETPLAWPTGINVEELPPQKTIGIRVSAPLPGPLTLEPRPARDGITVNEAMNIGADYRGQRYAIDEAVFHVPGLHIFPGKKAVYPAEYHIHFTTFSTPVRSLTLVIPVSHTVTDGSGEDYFASMAAVADPAATRPTLETLLKVGGDVLQYRGPDIRGRVGGDQPDTCDTDVTKEMQFLLIQTPCKIRAADLERIPREGTTRGVIVANDTASMPYPGIAPKARLTRDRLLRTVVLARPGILGPATATSAISTEPPLGPGGGQDLPSLASEYTCRPLQVVDGQDVVADSSTGGYQTLAQVLGLAPSSSSGGEIPPPAPESSSTKMAVQAISFFVGLIGVILARILTGYLWRPVFGDIPIGFAGWMKTPPLLAGIEFLAMAAIAGAALAGQDLISQTLGFV